MKSPIHCELVPGTFNAAIDAALITISLTEILEAECKLSLVRRASNLSTST
jgi:hypothetical protein